MKLVVWESSACDGSAATSATASLHHYEISLDVLTGTNITGRYWRSRRTR